MTLATSFLLFALAGLVGGLLLGLIGVGMALVAVPFLNFVLPRFGVPTGAVPLVSVATSMGIVAVGSVSSAIAMLRPSRKPAACPDRPCWVTFSFLHSWAWRWAVSSPRRWVHGLHRTSPAAH